MSAGVSHGGGHGPEARGHGDNPRDHSTHPSHVPSWEATDSAAVPWQGRDLSPSGYETDEGHAEPHVRVALALQDRSDAGERQLLELLAASRFLVPIVAEPVEVDDSGPLAVDNHVDMAAVTLVAPDGERALPVFTGVDSLAAWDAKARPVPVSAARAAQAALDESCGVMVVDVSGPQTRVLGSSALWSLALGRAWAPAAACPQVTSAVGRAVEQEEAVVGVRLAGSRGALQVHLTIRPGLDESAVMDLVTRVGERFAGDPEFRTRVDSVGFSIEGAHTAS